MKYMLATVIYFSAVSSAVANDVPHFKAEGHTFRLNEGCSPHAPSLELSLPAGQILAFESHPEAGDYLSYRLSLTPDHTIEVVRGYQHGGPIGTTELQSDQEGYGRSLNALLSFVDSVRVGSVCAAGVADLVEVRDYLVGLRSVR